jgi:DNA-binding beta-propeller fold protein YncE
MSFVKNLSSFIVAILSLAVFSMPATAASASAKYLYTLSDFTGIVRLSSVDITIDQTRNEAYVMPGEGVFVFNDKGMEIYNFNDGNELGGIVDTAVDEKGNIFALIATHDYRGEIVCLNYRGELVERIALKNIPEEFSFSHISQLEYQKGLLYLFASLDMKVLVIDRAGVFQEGYDLIELLGGIGGKNQREDMFISDFSVDSERNILFTIPAMFKAYVLSPDRKVRSFGRSGSAPGKFGVVSGIAADASGRFVFVADILRCVVMVFDREEDFRFMTEFGYRGPYQNNLVGPTKLAVDSENRVYVSQLADRGINVYQITVS